MRENQAVYFYEPNIVPNYKYPTTIFWGNWWSWNQAASYATDRAYDYVHVIAAYWSLYRVARNYPSLVKTNTWEWYLNQAVTTVATMTNGRDTRTTGSWRRRSSATCWTT